MLRITIHIERLLAVHNCVVVPGWGGFVLQTVSAVYLKDEHTFQPMRKEVVFNASLSHTDGLLTSSYMQAYQVDFRQAQAMVDVDVEEMRATLQRYGKIVAGSIGSFTTGEEGQLVFHPGKADVFDADYYGLTRFHFPLLPVPACEEHPVGKVQRKADVFYIPVNRTLIRSMVASAAAVALFLLLSTPVKDVNPAAYTASFVPTEHILPTMLTGQAPAEETTVLAEVTSPEETIIVDTPVAATPEPVVSVTPPVAASKKMYYTIVGSFPTEALADKFITEMNAENPIRLDVVVREGKYRVYTKAFDNREDAESYLTALRSDEKYQSAWLFITR